MATQILNHDQVKHRIRRIAYQIAEVYLAEEEIILAGIDGGGYVLAKKLKTVLSKITDAQITLCKLSMNKKVPLEPVSTTITSDGYSDKAIVLCDDVLNSGTTLIYGVRHFLKVPLKQLKTAVLVNRNHKKYPIKADFKGISLSTTLEENINVQIDKEPFKVILE